MSERNFIQEIENDKKTYDEYLNRYITNQKEKNCRDVLKRAMCLVASNDLEVNEKKEGSANKLPISTYFAHGSRILIEVPYDEKDPNYLMNWLSSGDVQKNHVSKQYAQGSTEADETIYRRSAATHGVKYSNNKFIEMKGKIYGASSLIGNLLRSTWNRFVRSPIGRVFQMNEVNETEHYGVDLSIKKPDKTPQHDGEHGHLYIYYKKPTSRNPGCIMLGCENAAPSSSKHSKIGSSSLFSPSGGVKLDTLSKLRDIEGEASQWKDVEIPYKYRSMRIIAPVTKETLKDISNIDPKELASNIPGSYTKTTLTHQVGLTDIGNHVAQEASLIGAEMKKSINNDNNGTNLIPNLTHTKKRGIRIV